MGAGATWFKKKGDVLTVCKRRKRICNSLESKGFSTWIHTAGDNIVFGGEGS